MGRSLLKGDSVKFFKDKDCNIYADPKDTNELKEITVDEKNRILYLKKLGLDCDTTEEEVLKAKLHINHKQTKEQINALFNAIIDKLEALPVLDRKPDLINEDGSYNKEQVKKQLDVYNAMYKAALAKQKRGIETDLDLAIINAHEETLLKVDKFVLLANQMRDVLVQKVENNEDISPTLEYLSNLKIDKFEDLTDEKMQEIMSNLGV